MLQNIGVKILQLNGSLSTHLVTRWSNKMARIRFNGLEYLAIGMGWNEDRRNKTGKLWRIKDGHPFHILVEKFGYVIVRDRDWAAAILKNPKDGTFAVLGCGSSDAPMTGSFLCDKVRAKKYGLHKLT